MADIGALVERLIEHGLSIGEASSIIAEAVAAGAATAAYRRSPGALRTEKWRVTKRHKASQCDTQEAASQSVTKRHKASQCDVIAVSSIDTNIKKDKRQNGERASRGTRIDPDWKPSSEEEQFAIGEGFSHAELTREASRFRDYWKGRAGSGGVKLDWKATWQNWIRTSGDRLGKAPKTPVNGGGGAGFLAKAGSEELEAWDAFNRREKGKSFPRDRNGDWRFPARWPPGHVPREPSTFEVPPAPLRQMNS